MQPADDTVAKAATLSPHPLRVSVLDEAHARPFHAMAAPRRLLHFAFVTSPEQAKSDRAAVAALCSSCGVPAPGDDAKHHRANLGEVWLRWEQHTEFTTYTLEFDGPDSLHQATMTLAAPMVSTPQPGPLLVSVDLRITTGALTEQLGALFDPSALALANLEGGDAAAATDFKADADGFVRILLVNQRLTDHRLGALAQRLLELETYRMLALIALPEAQRLEPFVRHIEQELPDITRGIMEGQGVGSNQELLDRLISLAAQLEASATSALYRFGASRAYHDIVRGRLEAINETPYPGYSTFSAFLSRRLSPAMRTCTTLEDRQSNLAQRLARAAQLLTARVEIELEQQNRDLLFTMNKRTDLQFRLQKTVETLSVAAVSYYIIAVLAYVFKGLQAVLPLNADVATAIAAPLVVVGVGFIVLRIHKLHGRETAPD